MTVELFSVIVDFLGGTYIFQIEAANTKDALDGWATHFASNPETSKQAALLFEESDADGASRDIVALDGLHHAWCATVTGKNGTALINLIKTVP